MQRKAAGRIVSVGRGEPIRSSSQFESIQSRCDLSVNQDDSFLSKLPFSIAEKVRREDLFFSA
jgi:hypothetical protein